mgnify:CR=1 FL=1
MKRIHRILIVFLFNLCLLSVSHFPHLEACTTFVLKDRDRLVFGRNYDWDVSEALILTNKRDVAKYAYTTDNPARWVSRYGSITFNQYGRA